MHRQSSRRLRTLRLVLTYIVMTLAIVVLVTIMVLFVNGYRYDGATGRFTQGGLVQLDSTPSGARVQIDGKRAHMTTGAHVVLSSGPHSFTMQKSGYNDWTDTVPVAPGNVIWLSYPRLVPKVLTPTTVHTFTHPVVDTSATPDGKYEAAVVGDGAPGSIFIESLAHDTVTSDTIRVPAKAMIAPSAKGPSTLAIASWSDDDHYLLVKHTYGKHQVEWLRIDRTGNHDVRNITRDLAVDFTKLVFRPASSSQLYGITSDGDLRRVDLSSDTVSGPIVSNVKDFTVSDNKTLTYVSTYDAKTRVRSVGYISDGATHGQVLRSYTDDGKSPLHIATDTYYGSQFVAISHGKQLDILEARLPNSDDTNGTSQLQRVASYSLPNDATAQLAFRTSSRFIVASGGGAVSVYDFGLDKFTTMKFGTPGAAQKWLDGYIAWTITDGTLQMIDFDGSNRHTIMPATAGSDATLSPGGKYLYAFATDKSGKAIFTRVQMILN